jgi:hypothetical protein
MAKKTKTAKKASKPKDRVKAALSAWAVRRELYGDNGISPEVMKERAKAKRAAAKKAKKRPAARKPRR